MHNNALPFPPVQTPPPQQSPSPYRCHQLERPRQKGHKIPDAIVPACLSSLSSFGSPESQSRPFPCTALSSAYAHRPLVPPPRQFLSTRPDRDDRATSITATITLAPHAPQQCRSMACTRPFISECRIALARCPFSPLPATSGSSSQTSPSSARAGQAV